MRKNKILPTISKVIIIFLTICTCLACIATLAFVFWSKFYLPDSPLRSTAPTLMPYISHGLGLSIICFTMPPVLMIAMIRLCRDVFRSLSSEE